MDFARGHFQRTQFCFGLRFKDRFYHFYGYSRNDTTPNVSSIKILPVKIAHHRHERFTQRILMCTPLGSMLAINKRVVLFTLHTLIVSKRNFDILAFKVYDVVKGIPIEVVLEQVLKTVLRVEFLTV